MISNVEKEITEKIDSYYAALRSPWHSLNFLGATLHHHLLYLQNME